MDKSIGALWIQTSENGEYWTGNIEINGVKQNVIVFKNSYKKDNQPDMRIFEKKQKEENQEKTEILDDSELPF